MKSLDLIAKPDKDRYVPPRRVQDIIPIKTIWEDGVFQVGRTRYSKTWKFSDINYQIASLEEREVFQRDYQALLNSLEDGSAAKITLMNRRMNRVRFEQEVLYPMKGDDLDGYRTEMNELLLDRTDGGCGILQDRYITVTVDRRTVQEARAALRRIGNSLFQQFGAMGSLCTELDATERVRLLHDFYRKDEESSFRFDLAEMRSRGYDFRDYICPDSVLQKPDYLMLGRQYARMLWVKKFATQAWDSTLYELTSELDRKMLVSIDVVPVPNGTALRTVRNKSLGVDTNIARWSRRQIDNGNITATTPYELEKQREEVSATLDAMERQDQRLFMMEILFVQIADSLEQLEIDTQALTARALERGFTLGVAEYQQMDVLKTALPIGVRRVDLMSARVTRDVAIFAPFRVQEVQELGGVYMGINAISGNLILANRANLKNGGGMIFGVPGSGKSMMAKMMIASILLLTDDHVIVCDPEREYTTLAEAFGGEVIRLAADSDQHYNPMDMDDDYGDVRGSLDDKTEFVLSFFAALARQGGGGIDWAKAQSIIARCCWEVYAEKNRKGTVPTLGRVREKLLEQPEQEAKDLALYLERFTVGTQGVFSHETNVDMKNRFIVIDIKDLGEAQKEVGETIVSDAMVNQVSRNWRLGIKTHVFIDEFHVMMENEHSAAFFDSSWRRFRKRGAYPTAITQNVDSILEHARSRAMISNSEFVVMLSQSDTDRQRLSELLHITDTQLQYVKNVSSGCGLLKYGESLIPFRNELPKDTKLYRLMTTKFGEEAGRALLTPTADGTHLSVSY